MALYNSAGTSEVEKTMSTYEDLGAFYVDTDGYPHGYIFGYTSHLMRRKAQVVEGETLISLGVNARRRLHSAPVEEVECGGRPNPEGAGSVSVTELSHYGEKAEGEGPLCQRCQIIATELNRQALALADPASLKDPGFAVFLFDKLQHLQCPHRGPYAREDSTCQVCGTALHQLRRLALQKALGLTGDMPDLHPGAFSSGLTPRPAAHSVGTLPCQDWSMEDSPAKQPPRFYDQIPGERFRGGLQGWGGIQSSYMGGSKSTVTPIPQHFLEGVWRVSRVRRDHHPHSAMTQGLAPDPYRNYMPIAPGSPIYDYANITPTVPQPQPTPTQTSHTPSAAASFFIRAAQKLSLSSKRKKPQQPQLQSPPEPAEPLVYTGGFSGALQLSPPAVPPCLLRAGSKVKDTPGMGKVKVMVRICSAQGSSNTSESRSFLKVDARKKQLTLCETSANCHSSAAQRRAAAAAPKMFAFDAVFSQDASQAEVCSGTVAEVIQSVVNGADGCIFCLGHANLGKTYTMIGRDCSTQSLGVAPCAISWLFKLIEERKEKAGARFSVRVSAVEISGRDEALTDLLSNVSTGSLQDGQSPGVYLREDPICGSQLQNQSELRAATAERAAYFLDTALEARSTSRPHCDEEERRNSHMLFTLHIYQYRMEKSVKGGMSGGRSRLHLLDLGSCETDIRRTREGGGGQCLSLSALGNVILALANGAKHVPYRDSKLTMLLRESLGNINCRTTMIAHISDSPTNYMETLTTVQLASRIHRMRKKKSKYASSSSGGESSCEEGRIRKPHLRPFHPRTVALDPDMPTLLSSDPDYSSSSEHSCDTVIYIGPGGATISDRELSDNEGPPSFVPIIPSLNRKRGKDTQRPEVEYFKCDTFAELQERLECIDGSEGPAAFTGEGKGAQIAQRTNSPEETVSPKTVKSPSQKPLVSTTTTNTAPAKSEQEHSKLSLDGGDPESHKRTSADGEKILACVVKPSVLLQDSEPVVREKVYLNKGPTVPKPSASPSLPRSSRTPSQGLDAICRAPPVGMSQQALRQGQHGGSPVLERAHHGRSPMEMSHLRAALRGRCLERDVLRTTITLQQPVELNGEDELVFTVVEDLPIGLVPDNGRPSSIISFNSDCSLQALASGSRPVSIISSINDEFDAYTAQECASGVSSASQEEMFAHHGTRQSSIGSWPSEVSVCSLESDGTLSTSRFLQRAKCMVPENTSILSSPGIFRREPFLQHGTKSSLNDSGVCFSELDSDPATPSKLSLTKCPPSPDSTKASLRANTLNTSASSQIPHHAVHSSLPRKTKPTSSVAPSCSRQEGKQDDLWLRGGGHSDPRATESTVASKPPRNGVSGLPSRKPGGNSNSVPRPPKAQVSSSTQRVVDGCEKSSSKKAETMSRMPQLRRGATTLGTVSVPHSSPESKWGRDGSGSLRFSSLGKKANGQKSSMLPKSGSISPPAPPVRKSSLDQKTRIVLSPSALRAASDAARSSLPKTSVSEEEFDVRFRGDLFSYKTSSLKADHGSAKTASSLKTRGAKGDSGRYYGSLMSLERSDSLTSVRSRPGLSRENSGISLGDNGKSNRSVPKLGVPTSTTSTSTATSPPSSTTFATSSKLGQLKANVNPRAIVASGSKARTLSASSSKTLNFSTKSDDAPTARNASLPPTGKPPARSLAGTNGNGKPGRGTIMGTKQAIRAANSRVSELVAGSPRKHLSRGSGDNANDSRASVSGSPVSTPLPSPYSKITAPRRPQRYSSGHGSDNSSVLSGELPPAMGRTALFYHSGGSSGYESMIRDSETTGSASSAHDSMSESGVSTSNRSRVSKSPKKRGNGLQRRRLIPAPLPDTSSLGRKAGVPGQWVDLPPLGGTLKEPFEIKVYEIDDVERLQRRREGATGTEGLLYFNARLRMLEKRQQRIRELRAKHERLSGELEDAKSRLMLDPGKWTGEFEVDPDLDKESQEYLDALEQATGELEYCVNLCKSHVMMETCFDIVVSATAVTQGGQQKGGVEV
uniref:kinesin-like protein KIF26A isoform X3 n=1 Tax=Oncorhynchus gorbuscha TaxID=8017 RepID=UPI001EAF7604|nr:kinesin-like protein KIF26A isoform X3 [Oncorhynchus gorbuscha]